MQIKKKFTLEEKQRVVDLILNELSWAESKFEWWPDDPIHAAGIIGEESGELMQAAIDFFYKNESHGIAQTKMFNESIQVGAMAIRFLLNLSEYKRNTQED